MRSIIVLALLPACSSTYLVEGRDLDRARQLQRTHARVALPAQNETSGARVQVDVRRLHDKIDPIDGPLVQAADPPSVPQPLTDGRLRVRARPHLATRMGIGLFAIGASMALLGGVSWAARGDPCANDRGFCLDFGGAIAQAFLYTGAVAAVAGIFTWTIGAATRPVEVTGEGWVY